MFPLLDFESHVSPTILTRGHAYFRDGAVAQLEESDAGPWEAVVSGNADYQVFIKLTGKKVASWNCNCPYADGPICKHVVAVLYKLREEGAAPLQKRKRRAPKTTFEDILAKLDIEELRAFIQHQKTVKHDFKEEFLLFFSDMAPQIDVEEKYRKMVQKLIRTYTDHGFMDYRSTFTFTNALHPTILTAEHAVSRKSFSDAIVIAQTICLEIMDLLQNSDDSAGNLGGTISQSIQILHNIAQHQAAAPALLEQLFAWLEKQLVDAIWFDYGDFGYELLGVAESIATRVDAERFLQLLDQLIASKSTGMYGQYTRDALTIQKVNFLKALGRHQEADQLMATNMEIVKVRLSVVEKAIEQQDYKRAKQLIAEGITLAENKNHPGTVSQWENVLMQIAHLENDLDTFRTIAKKFTFQWGVNLEYYHQWKSSFPPREWQQVIEQHIQAVIREDAANSRKSDGGRNGRRLFSQLAPIYIEEKQWERLLRLLPPVPNKLMLEKVHPYLVEPYPQELLELYLRAMDKMGDEANSRNQYRSLAKLMQRVKKDIEGSHTRIDELATALLQKYPLRRAMKEELNKVLDE